MVAGVFAFRSRPDLFNASAAFDLRKLSFREAAVNFALFATIGFPIALAIGFLRPTLALPNPSSIPAAAATAFFLNALPEEILFRGILQHVIERASKSRTAAAVVAALIFGAAHLNNGNFPNYKYFAMATLAGLFYGRAWRSHRNVLTSALTHTMVNVAWRLFLR
jgi:membrane protease YdiL (CAAX protease family)